MLCDRCNENEANIHVKKIINGKSTEIHLCEQCAKETKEYEISIPISFQDFLVGIMDLNVKELEEFEENQTDVMLRCSKCGMTYEDFKSIGKLGCPECYDTFKEQLPVVFKKLHGHTNHVGKIPSKFAKTVAKQKSLSDLKQELEKAILDEEFEKAAELRDKIRAKQKKAKI